jgi:uncharacterized protein with NAD-binding domain and iron-sulfur cluster
VKTRVAVLGGGPGAIAAAFELTATDELRERYEVTVHQLGWRLGGKGASGRNAARGQRIEEHGLHIWFGFYDNAFSVMQRCYEELGRPPDTPLAIWTDAFKPKDDCVQYELFEGEWVPHHFRLPRNPLTPGDENHVGLWEVLRRTFEFLTAEWRRVGKEESEAARLLDRLHAHAARHASLGTRAHEEPLELRLAAELARGARDRVWRHVVSERVADKGLRLFFMWLDLAAAMLTGIVEDRLPERGFGAINDEELRAWLTRHGASELTVKGSPMIRAVYDAAFCYERGDIARPNVAAGKAAQDLIRSIFLYKGALMYKMQAGMGDTVFGPFYEVLRRRGVRFEFFHCVTRLGASAGGGAVDEIDVVPQATVRGSEYRPLVEVKGLPCWPSEPDWSQLEEGEALRARGVDLEREPNPLGRPAVTLRRGDDFDSVVLGIPVGALPPICGELAAANQRFAEMLEHSDSVMTQAFQLWLKRDAADLGFPYPAGTLASCYVEPLDTYCDMNQLLAREDWPAAADLRQIAYFCGVLPEEGVATQAEADELARISAIEYLRRDVKRLWPESRGRDGFDWDLLVGGDGFDSQYWRGNFTGSERYALTLAGSVRYRLWPNESGFENLFLAGDWTRNGIDGGSVEAAVTSGMLAAQAISGEPRRVSGATDWLESDRGDAPA